MWAHFHHEADIGVRQTADRLELADRVDEEDRRGGGRRVARAATGRGQSSGGDAARKVLDARVKQGELGDDVDVFGVELRPAHRQLDALGLPLGVGQHEVDRVAVDGVADDLAVDLRAPSPGVVETLQGHHAAALGHHDAVAVGVVRR